MDLLELDKQIRLFLAEDIGQGDITTDPIFTDEREADARFVACEPLVAVGMLNVAARVFQILNQNIVIEFAAADGLKVATGEVLLKLRGPVRDLLRGERVALNLVQRLCGIAA